MASRPIQSLLMYSFILYENLQTMDVVKLGHSINYPNICEAKRNT